MRIMSKARKSYFLRVTLPILAGTVIYFLFRGTNLVMFELINSNALNTFLLSLHEMSKPVRAILPGWFLQSLPDALWCFACISFILIYWRGGPLFFKIFWLSAAVVLSLGFEVGQRLGIVPGTFCVHDLVFSIVAVALALFAEAFSRRGYNKGFRHVTTFD
jgi:hypothetical protein